MRRNLKDFKRFKFPMTEEEQAILLKELDTMEEEIRARLAWLTPDMDKTLMSMRDFRRFMEEILGDKIAE